MRISKRHLAKSFTWRFIGTVDTFLLSLLITGNWSYGIKLSAITTVTKLLLYYFHELIWFRSNLDDSNKRHVIKTFSWRLIGTLDTIFFGWLLTTNPFIGIKIGVIETLSKMLLYFVHEKLWYKTNYGLENRSKFYTNKKVKDFSKKKQVIDIINQPYEITRKNREKLHGHKSYLLWFTGLSGSGKSTLANLVEIALYKKGFSVYVLDGDNIRRGINNNLTFSPEDRSENIRRVGEISKLMLDAGIITLATFISPYFKDRQAIREIIGPECFIEIYVSTSLEECERRDVKGLYKKARSGKINNMTGISAPYEAPFNADIEVFTDNQSIDESVSKILDFIYKKIQFQNV